MFLEHSPNILFKTDTKFYNLKIKMKKQIFTIFAFALILIGTQQAQAQDTKIAYADADSILRALPETAEQQKRLEAYAKQWEDQLKKLEADYKAKIQDFTEYQKNTPQADIIPKILQDKAQDVQALEQRIQQEQQDAQRDVQNKEQQLLSPLLEKIKISIDETAKEKGYSFVVPANVLLYADPAHDLTNMVIKKLGGKVSEKIEKK